VTKMGHSWVLWVPAGTVVAGPLGYELAGCHLPQPIPSQKRGSQSIAHPSHRAVSPPSRQLRRVSFTNPFTTPCAKCISHMLRKIVRESWVCPDRRGVPLSAPPLDDLMPVRCLRDVHLLVLECRPVAGRDRNGVVRVPTPSAATSVPSGRVTTAASTVAIPGGAIEGLRYCAQLDAPTHVTCQNSDTMFTIGFIESAAICGAARPRRTRPDMRSATSWSR